MQRVSIWIAFCACLIANGIALGAPRVVFVNRSAPEGGDGKSWGSAHRFLQDALFDARATATSSSNAVEIWVAKGTYVTTEGVAFPPGDSGRSASFQLANFVSVFGGFSGSESSRFDRDATLNTTILSGDIGGDDPAYGNRVSAADLDFGTFAENAQTVVTGVGLDSSVTLSGCVVTGGSNETGLGGAITWTSNDTLAGGPLVEDCLIVRNRALRSGALSCDSTRFSRVQFFRNMATQASPESGGGVLASGPGIQNSKNRFINCVFASNRSLGIGGALLVSTPNDFFYCTMADNRGDLGGGGIFAAGGPDAGRYWACVVQNNTSVAGASDVELATGISEDSKIEIRYCTLDVSDVIGLRLEGDDLVPAGAIPTGFTGKAVFVDPSRDNYRLKSESECIDRALDGCEDCPWEVLSIGRDFDRRYRAYRARTESSGILDPGAFEFASPTIPSVIHVDPAATHSGNGYSWADACKTIDEGINRASSGDTAPREVWIKKGLYRLSNQSPSRLIYIGSGAAGVRVRGGFTGDEINPMQRRAGDTSVLSGDLLGDDDGTLATISDNQGPLVQMSGVLDISFDRITIYAGHSPDGFEPGGVRADGSRVAFQECDFVANWGRNAAAIEASYTSAEFASCKWSDNRGYLGTTFSVNDESNVKFDDCLFSDNTCRDVGALRANSITARTVFRDCDFVRNVSDGQFFGATAGALSLTGEALLVGCRFQANSSFGSGSIWSHSTNVRVWQCLFVANESWSNGAGVFDLSPAADALGPEFLSCTFAGNKSPQSRSAVRVPGAVASGRVIFGNTIFWGNTSMGQASLQAQVSIDAIIAGSESSFLACTVQGWNGSTGRGNNANDPRFIRPPASNDYGDMHLLVGSPCINSGDDTALPFDELDLDDDGVAFETLPVDLDGSVRRRGVVDRGVYEYATDCPSCPGVREWQSNAAIALFSDSLNWFPSVPNSSHDARFGKSQAFTVGFSRNEQTGSVDFDRGDITLDLAGRNWALRSVSIPGKLNALTIDSRAYESTTVRVRGGVVTTGQGSESVIGRSMNSNGILDVSGSASSFSAFGTLRVGLDGAGTLKVLGGASVTASQLDIAGTAGGLGTALVEGVGSKLKVNVFGSVGYLSGQSAPNTATAVLEVRDGGIVQASGAGLIVLQSGRLRGNGSVVGSVVSIGEVAPGTDLKPPPSNPFAAFGTLTISGSYDQLGSLGPGSGADAGRLSLRSGSGQQDRLLVNGAARLAGAFRLSLAGRNAQDIEFERQRLANLSPTARLRLISAYTIRGPSNQVTRFDVATFPSLITSPNAPRKFLKLIYNENAPLQSSNVQDLVWLGNGDLGSWTPPVGAEAGTAPGTPTAATATDLDGDGLDDLAVTTSNGSSPGNLYIFFNRGTDGSGAWKGLNDPLVLNVGVGPSAVITAQLRPTPDGTIGQDIVVANQQSGSVMIFRNNVVQSSAGLGETVPANAIGSTPEVIDLGPDSQPVGLAAGAFAPGHFTGDPADVTVSCNGLGVIRLFPNDGSGGLGAGFVDIPLEGGSFMRPISFDQDPRRKSYMAVINKVAARKGPEGAAALPGESQLVLIGNDSESIPPSYPIVATYAAGLNPVDIQVASLQGVTGHATPGLIPDLAVVSSGDGGQQGGVTLLIADQASMQNPGAIAPAYTTSIFLEGQGESLKGNPLSLALVDVDRDGDLDVTVLTKQPTESPSVEILRNDLVVNGQINSLSFSPELETVDVGTAPVQIVGANLTVRNAASKLDILGLNSEVLLRLRAKGGSPPASILAAQVPRSCPADINKDGLVEDADFSIFVVAYDTLDCAAPEMPPYCPADLNLDGLVDDRDFSAFVVAYNALLCV